jgi:dTDP-4-dehydrorhamnose 3,5-epimerase
MTQVLRTLHFKCIKMKFIETLLPGAFLVELDPRSDERGFFARTFSSREFESHGLRGDLTEVSISRNYKSGTLRGMHFQRTPHEETKFVRVVRGRIFDVIVDIRKTSPMRGRWFGRELSAETGLALYVPAGFAHGFLTLEDHTDVLYHISDTYCSEAAAGFVWNDPQVAIHWPKMPVVMSAADRSLPEIKDNV